MKVQQWQVLRGNSPNSGKYEGELAVPGLSHLLLLLHLGKPLPLPAHCDGKDIKVDDDKL